MPATQSSAKSELVNAPALPVGVGIAEKLGFAKLRGKLLAGLGVLGIGLYGVFSEQNYVSATNAVVSAYVVSVRTPIDGIVAGLPTAAGVYVHEGEILGEVENPRTDQQHLENLRVMEERTQSEAGAISVEQEELEKQRRELQWRASTYAKAVSERLQVKIKEDEGLLLAKLAEAKQSKRDLERGHQLRASGINSDAEVDKLETQNEIAQREAEAQQAALSATRTEAEAARKGIFIEPGENEIGYSRQRSDEIQLRLAEVNRNLTALKTQAVAAEEQLRKETHYADLMYKADLVSPISGLLWRLDAMNGERVATGDTVGEYVECRQSFVLAEIPQDRVPEIAVGAEARVKLSGEIEERVGTIVSVNGDPQKDGNQKLAAVPFRDTKEQMAMVRVELNADSTQSECIVGRTARVLLATRRSNLLSKWMRGIF
jgi:multidrug resistance efflux pump